MATPTSVELIRNDRVQFQGLFQQAAVVVAVLPSYEVSGNANADSVIPAPGIQHGDCILGWGHYHEGAHDHEVVEEFHSWDNEIHLVVHNRSGNPVTMPVTTYRLVLARLV